MDFGLVYDPDLLTIRAIALGDGVSGLIAVNLDEPGHARVAVALAAPLGEGPVDLVMLTAEVPSSAVYRTHQVIEIVGPSVNEGQLLAVGDSAVHVAAFLGDTTGNRGYRALDGQRALRVATGLDSGFAAYPLVDPAIIADITGNGAISALDGARILQEAVGIDRPEIPPLPPVIFGALAAGTSGMVGAGVEGERQSAVVLVETPILPVGAGRASAPLGRSPDAEALAPPRAPLTDEAPAVLHVDPTFEMTQSGREAAGAAGAGSSMIADPVSSGVFVTTGRVVELGQAGDDIARDGGGDPAPMDGFGSKVGEQFKVGKESAISTRDAGGRGQLTEGAGLDWFFAVVPGRVTSRRPFELVTPEPERSAFAIAWSPPATASIQRWSEGPPTPRVPQFAMADGDDPTDAFEPNSAAIHLLS